VVELHGLIKQSLFQSKFFTSKDLPILKEETNKAIADFINEAKKIIESLDLPNKVDLLESLSALDKLKNVEHARFLEKKIEASLYLRNFTIIEDSYSPRDLSTKTESNSNLKILQKRLQPWLFNEMIFLKENAIKDFKSIIQQTTSNPEVLESQLTCSRDFFDKMRSQSKKAIIIHSIALASLGITIGSIAVSTLALPMLIPFSLSAISFISSFATTILQKGLLPAQGNRIDWDYILPDCIRKKFA
jgi:hypothetical protein